MSGTTYKQIMDALLALLQANCGSTFRTYSRRLVMWEQLSQQIANTGTTQLKQPALYLFDGVIIPESGVITYERTLRAVPNKREIQRAIVIYAQMPGGTEPGGVDLTTPGGDVLFPLIEAVENAIEPSISDPNGAQTLGGLVYHCWIQGKGYTFTGDIDANGQGMAILPIKILIP
jgi:hypothetical protein